jgi:hypothetical protein
MNESELNKFYLRKKNYIEDKLKSLEKNVSGLQNDLMQLIMSDYIGKFDVKDGKLVVSQKNLRLAAELDRIMDLFNSEFQQSVLKKTANDMLKMTGMSVEYYTAMGFSEKTLKSIEEKTGFISTRIGITKKGEIIKGSYLDSLSQNTEVRMELKDYVLNSISTAKPYNEYLKGFRETVVGGKEINGALERYYSQYAYDSFNQVEAAIENKFATELDLKYFIYSGGIIATSRAFCRKRAGKVFSIEETANWKCDPDLIGKPKGQKCDDSYNPLIDRGRYRCRHVIQYISDEMAFKLRPELKK